MDNANDAITNLDTSVTAAAEQLATAISSYGLGVIGGIVLLIAGWLASRIVSRALERNLRRFDQLDPSLRRFFVSGTRYVIVVVTVLAVLSEFGVQTSSLIAVFGAVGLAIGLALQGTLSNLAAGVMLLLFRPFKVGNYVEVGGHKGTVRAIDLFVTELSTPDNVQIVVPNGKVWGSAVVNYSYHDSRRVDLVVGIDYGDDIGDAIKTVESVIAEDPRCRPEPAPLVAVGELADSSVNLIVRVWCDAGDYGSLKFDLTRRFKEALDAAGISIPFPQRTVHLLRQPEHA